MRRADYANPVPEGNEMRGGNFSPLLQPGICPRMPPINANESKNIAGITEQKVL